MRAQIIEEKVRRVSLGLAVQPRVSLRVVHLRVGTGQSRMRIITTNGESNWQRSVFDSVPSHTNCGSVSHLQDENLFEATPVCAAADNLEVAATRRVPEGAVLGRLWLGCKGSNY